MGLSSTGLNNRTEWDKFGQRSLAITPEQTSPTAVTINSTASNMKLFMCTVYAIMLIIMVVGAVEANKHKGTKSKCSHPRFDACNNQTLPRFCEFQSKFYAPDSNETCCHKDVWYESGCKVCWTPICPKPTEKVTYFNTLKNGGDMVRSWSVVSQKCFF